MLFKCERGVCVVPCSAALVKVHIVLDDIVLLIYADLQDGKSIFITVPVNQKRTELLSKSKYIDTFNLHLLKEYNISLTL